ncbi:hypothetical protein M5X00_24175 [Paenibacillus alvei]|uniref:Uncharacterized protein n=1 Tax=Paenibacillus alvei TaxID=44250 RepID=A0ABT4GR48_PAEAL|nr:hypothetical protein [Paenibacillus alvei]MCY9543617.1 hypothetical protein [Paenibacillus alvei]MCY9736128.1 hypothetical protein [Paenibacillus alvei]MCY9757327.1 hypothetical protein [Paenibacillus alvei]MCY9759142.1 hypothetical protein [Paenibacillus alvei]MCY9770399.1 hypothetical protein [Paenibacillus alvei]
MYRHLGMVTSTKSTSWNGIQAEITLPSSSVPVYGYIDWYLGLGKAGIESGISKNAGDGYRVFLGGVGLEYKKKSIALYDGQKVRLKLYQYSQGNNRFVTLLVNDVEQFVTQFSAATKAAVGVTDVVKMVHGVEDQGHCSFNQTSFSNVLLRQGDGSTYTPWTSSIPYDFVKKELNGSDSGMMSTFTVHSQLPLSTSLKAAR